MENQFLNRSYIFILFLISLNIGCGKSESPDPNPPQPAPGITGFSPLAAAAGEQVTITGSNFSTNTATNNVKFNGTTATVSTATTTQLIATVPAGVTNGKISVTVNNQTATSSAEVYSRISVQRLDDFIVPKFCWLDFLLQESLYKRYGFPVSICASITLNQRSCALIVFLARPSFSY